VFIGSNVPKSLPNSFLNAGFKMSTSIDSQCRSFSFKVAKERPINYHCIPPSLKLYLLLNRNSTLSFNGKVSFSGCNSLISWKSCGGF
jgi:hypothetical protein